MRIPCDMYVCANYIDRRIYRYDPNVYTFQKENQNLLGNPPPNFREAILRGRSYFKFWPTSAGARFRLAIFRGYVYPRQSK